MGTIGGTKFGPRVPPSETTSNIARVECNKTHEKKEQVYSAAKCPKGSAFSSERADCPIEVESGLSSREKQVISEATSPVLHDSRAPTKTQAGPPQVFGYSCGKSTRRYSWLPRAAGIILCVTTPNNTPHNIFSIQYHNMRTHVASIG